MSQVLLAALLLGASLTAYVVLGGADFGGGVWDLFASGPRRDAQRRLIEKAIGPIWEANHVWLVFAVVILFTAFPHAFVALMTSLHLPLLLVLLGIVLRGSAFAFRSYGARDGAEQRRWGRVFAVASTITPLMLGVAAGAVAAERAGLSGTLPAWGFVGSWLSAFPLSIGVFTLLLFAYLAAVYLTLEAKEEALQEDFRRRALVAGVGVGVSAAASLLLARNGAPEVWETLTGERASPLFQLWTGALAVGALGALFRRRYRLARVLAPLQAASILWGWFASQAPQMVPPDLDWNAAAAPAPVLALVVPLLLVGTLLLLPAVWLLFRVFGKGGGRTGAGH